MVGEGKIKAFSRKSIVGSYRPSSILTVFIVMVVDVGGSGATEFGGGNNGEKGGGGRVGGFNDVAGGDIACGGLSNGEAAR